MDSKRLIIISVIAGLIGSLLIFIYVKKKERELILGIRPIKILVAKQDIPPKSIITKDMFRIENIPEKFRQPTSIYGDNENAIYVGVQEILGYVNLVPIAKGQQIMRSEILPPSIYESLSVKVPIGKRAMVIPVMNTDLFDLLKPGDYVDILNTFSVKSEGGASLKRSVTILQNVLVLSVGKNLGEVRASLNQKETGDAKRSSLLTVGIAVDPEEAQLIALALSQGDIYVTIRNANDSEGKLLRPVGSEYFLK